MLAVGTQHAGSAGALGAPTPARTLSSSQPAPSAPATAEPAPSGAAAEGAELQRAQATLSIGSRGPAVVRLKRKLRAMKYAVDSGPVYTQATAHAVMAFQKVNRIGRDGVAGPQTQRALQEPVKPDIGRGPSERVVVDLSDQVLYMVRGGKLDKIVNASTGNANLADGKGMWTPPGTFTVGRKYNGPEVAPLGTLYWPSYFNGGIAVHGSPSVPAGPASHGCVRIPMHLAQKIYNEMPSGMTVKVRN